MNKWTERLRAVLPADCTGLRPFVCNGFPCQSEAIIIGKNPATKLHTNWWDFWSDERGFEYAAFLSERKPKKRGARLRMEHMRVTRKVECVETNVYRNEAQRGEVEEKIANVSVVELLLKNMPKLRAVIIHGAKARKFIDRDHRGQGIFKALQPLEARGIKIFSMCHLCNASYGCIDAVCDWIEANRLDKCARCESNSPSQCLENRPGA